MVDKHSRYFVDYLEKAVKEYELTEKEVYIFGTTGFFQKMTSVFDENGVKTKGYLDNNELVQGSEINHIPVIAPKDLIYSDKTRVIINSNYDDEMIGQLISLGADSKHIINLKKCLKYTPKRNNYYSEKMYRRQMKDLYLGEQIYTKLHADGECLYVLPTGHLGDTYVFMTFFHAYLNKNDIKKYKLVIASGKAQVSVMRLFNEENFVQIAERELGNLTRFVYVIGERILQTKLMITHYRTIVNTYSIHVLKKMTWHEHVGKHLLFLDDLEDSFEAPRFEDVDKEYLEELGLVFKKSVIVAPYAQSNGLLPMDFWIALCTELQKKGYKVFTSVSGDEVALPGTEEIFIPIVNLKSYLEYAGYFVALRSGLCDVTAVIRDCKQVVLFGEGFEVGFDHVDSLIDGNLLLPFNNADICQLSYSGLDVHSLIQSAVNYICERD